MMAKKPYQKPEVKAVELRPEEAVLTACTKGSLLFCRPGSSATGCFPCPSGGS
jgi:hypothetical protein